MTVSTSIRWPTAATSPRAQLYLAYSEAGFRSDYLGVSQLQMAREPA